VSVIGNTGVSAKVRLAVKTWYVRVDLRSESWRRRLVCRVPVVTRLTALMVSSTIPTAPHAAAAAAAAAADDDDDCYSISSCIIVMTVEYHISVAVMWTWPQELKTCSRPGSAIPDLNNTVIKSTRMQ